MKFSEMKMGVKMGVGFGLMICRIVVILAATLFTFHTVGKHAKKLEEDSIPVFPACRHVGL